MGVERDGQRGCEMPRRTERTCFFHNLAANVTYLMFHSISPSIWTTKNLVDSAFLTHGDARERTTSYCRDREMQMSHSLTRGRRTS